MTDLPPGPHVTNPSLAVQASLHWTTLTPAQAERLHQAIGTVPSAPFIKSTAIRPEDVILLNQLKGVLERLMIPQHAPNEAITELPSDGYISSIFPDTMSFDLQPPALQPNDERTLKDAGRLAFLGASPSETVRTTVANIRAAEDDILGRSATLMCG